MALSEPLRDNHNDLYEIEFQFEVVTATLEMAGIHVEGLFLNAHAGFASRNLRSRCEAKEINANMCFSKRSGNTNREENFDGELYGERYAVERTNAWMDNYRSLLNRFESTVDNWKGFNYLTIMVIALKKFKKKKKKKV